MPSETAREQILEEFRRELASVLDWNSASMIRVKSFYIPKLIHEIGQINSSISRTTKSTHEPLR